MAECLATGPESVPFVLVVSVLAASLALVAVFESRRGQASDGSRNLLQRWVLGIGLWALGTALGGAIMPDRAAGFLVFDRFACLPAVVQFGVLVIAIDFLQTLIHRELHRWPLLWRFHAIHHADRRFDTATSLRFHPIETLLRSAADAALVLCLGPAPIVISVAVIFLSVWNVFDHGRLALPPAMARGLERLFVTPDYHRVHHAVDRSMHDSNFGGVFTLWDRWLGWYRRPAEPAFEVGVDGWRAGDDLLSNLGAPLRAEPLPPSC
ncbi:MAG: sterol desaturase family protein [Burkholderiales bacterium]